MSADGWACDTSVAIAALDPSHDAHPPCRRALADLRPALAGHAVFETYSVLTRLPVPLRLTAEQARSVLTAAFPAECWLDPAGTRDLWGRLAPLGIVGGSVYDALVGRGPTDGFCSPATSVRNAPTSRSGSSTASWGNATIV